MSMLQLLNLEPIISGDPRPVTGGHVGVFDPEYQCIYPNVYSIGVHLTQPWRDPETADAVSGH